MTEDEREDLSEIVRSNFYAWTRGDRSEFEAALAEDFTFTSPYDDHIDKATYFERCWPSQSRPKLTLLAVAQDGARVLVVYDCAIDDGTTFRNMEAHTLMNGKVKSVEVFFGDPPAGVRREEFRAFLDVARKSWKRS
ncbi:MAG: nuclear transport factor 2 family protein [Polyangiaceae bacterium]